MVYPCAIAALTTKLTELKQQDRDGNENVIKKGIRISSFEFPNLLNLSNLSEKRLRDEFIVVTSSYESERKKFVLMLLFCPP